jgi:ABC-type transport system involved in cytochrome c biogenesis permease subunit
MGDFISVILSNEIYTIVAVVIIGVIIFFAIKKLIKLLIYATIILIAFLAYAYYTGKSVDSVIEPVEKAVDKAENIIK